jgi:hypothetical protein
VARRRACPPGRHRVASADASGTGWRRTRIAAAHPAASALDRKVLSNAQGRRSRNRAFHGIFLFARRRVRIA